MKKKELINRMTIKYDAFVKCMKKLTDEECQFSFQGKWSGSQQLEHIALCIKPIVQIYSLPKSIIEDQFGKTNRKNRSYQELLNDYLLTQLGLFTF